MAMAISSTVTPFRRGGYTVVIGKRGAAAFSEAIASHSLTWATHHYDKPSNSQL